jgi:hypothetical protein
MRRGAWDIAARISDMDLNGVYASLCFPSFLPGFTGQRLQQLTDDPDLALASVRAWNDWVLEDWVGYAPGRMIPLQIPYLLDPEVAAAEVRRNAERGFTAVTFSADGCLRGDGHGRVPTRRVIGHVTPDVAGRALRHHRRVVLRVRDVRGRRLALLAHSRALPRDQDLHE